MKLVHISIVLNYFWWIITIVLGKCSIYLKLVLL